MTLLSASNGPVSKKAILALTCVTIDLAAVFFAIGRRENQLAPVWIYLSLYAAAFLLYWYASARLLPYIDVDQKKAAWFVFGIAVLLRLLVLVAPPSLSTDMYRYVWDGRLTCHGINPYRWSPFNPRLASLRDYQIWVPMEYKAYQTVYMPTSEMVFAAAHVLVHNSLYGYKAIFTMFDIASIGLIMRILPKLGRSPGEAIWYAWNPLPITEVALAGHQDSIGSFLLVLTFWYVVTKRPRWAAVSVVGAGLTKGFALLLLPIFARQNGRRFVAVAFLALLYLGMPLWVYAPQFLHGMDQYLTMVHVNGGLFIWVDGLLEPFTVQHYKIASRIGDLIILYVLVTQSLSAPNTTREIVRRSLITIATCLLVVPTLFPWYLLWVLPLVVLYDSKPSQAFIVFSGTVALVYTYYIDKTACAWATEAEYILLFLMLIWEASSGYWCAGPPGDVEPGTDVTPSAASLE